LSSSPDVGGVDFFAHGGLPVPQVTILQAERVAALFGLTVRAQPLGSQQDSNFLLADGGSVVGVLKIANPAFSAAEIEAQDAAAAHIAAACQDLRVATVTHGPAEVPLDGEVALARVLRFLPGGTLAGAGRYLSPRAWTGCCSGTCGTRCAWWTRWPATCGTKTCATG
jgi:Ser/Thr protein kinase RdoA (MazF antagonist)